MDNNDILIRLRYALDIKNTDMIEIFKLGGVSVTKEEVLKLLQKSKNNVEAKNNPVIDNLICDNFMLESFLNGLIGFKRGPQEESAQLEETTLPLKTTGNINNVLLKKLKNYQSLKLNLL